MTPTEDRILAAIEDLVRRVEKLDAGQEKLDAGQRALASADAALHEKINRTERHATTSLKSAHDGTHDLAASFGGFVAHVQQQLVELQKIATTSALAEHEKLRLMAEDKRRGHRYALFLRAYQLTVPIITAVIIWLLAHWLQ